MNLAGNPPRPAATKGCQYVARQEIDHHGRIFRPGDVFPYAELGLDEIKAYNLHRAGVLAVATPDDLERLTAPSPAVTVTLPGVTSAGRSAEVDQRERAANAKPRIRR